MGDEGNKRIILARRARFVAAAIASLSVAATADGCAGGTGSIGADDGGTNLPDGADPKPCLAPRQEPPDAGPDDDGGKDAEPQPCLIAPLDGG
jgi:hypothetical protein